MVILFPSDEWIKEWRERLNDNDEYEKKGSGWGVDFNGDFVFIVESDDRLPETKYYFVGLEDGKCTEAREIDNPEEVDHGFKYVGDYTDWVALNNGEIGPIDGMMSGVFEVEGDMQRILAYSNAAVVMSETGREIDTDYHY